MNVIDPSTGSGLRLPKQATACAGRMTVKDKWHFRPFLVGNKKISRLGARWDLSWALAMRKPKAHFCSFKGTP